MEQVRVEAYKQVFLSRTRGVRAARVLFDYYIDLIDAKGYVRRRKDEIAAALNVSARTVANYILTLRDLDLIKRKYDGQTVINPDYYFAGSAAELEAAKMVYTDFKSDDINKKVGKENGRT